MVFLVVLLATACAVWYACEGDARVGNASIPFGQFDEMKGIVKMVRCAAEGVPCLILR